jgi:predicted regulator of Ras-like GTPase activity (Roadblock/LC7/MglB family)
MTQHQSTLSPLVLHLAQREAQAFLDEVDGVTAVVVASIDGFDIASAIRGDIDPSRVAAIASSIAAIGSVVAQEAALGNPTSVMINTDNGFAQVFSVHRADMPLVINVIADARGVLAQVAYRGVRFAKALRDA